MATTITRPDPTGWRPECGAVRGHSVCELLAGHEGAHCSRMGAEWPSVSPAEPAPVAPPGLHPTILEGLLHRLGNDLVDAHGDELVAAVHAVAERAACDAYKLGALHRENDPAEEAEQVKALQEARNAGYDEGFRSGREQGQRDERARSIKVIADLRDHMRRMALKTSADAEKYEALAREAREIERSYLAAANGLVDAGTRLGDGEAT